MSDTALRWFERTPTAETLTQHARWVARLRAKHPTIFNAMQPAELPPLAVPNTPGQVHPFKSITEQVEAGSYRLRNPATSTAGLVSAAPEGNCLVPLVLHGDVVWLDPTAEPVSGDICAVLFTAEAFEYIAGFHAAKYGAPVSAISPYALKILWNERGQWLLLTRSGSIPAAAAVVCGVVRRIERNGESLYGAS